MSPKKKQSCSHESVVVDISPYGAAKAKYERPDWKRRVGATTASGRFPANGPDEESREHTTAFPAPLLLPGDEIDSNPRYPPQSMRSWLTFAEWSRVTPRKKTIYVARPPSFSADLSDMKDWSTPTGLFKPKKGKKGAVPKSAERPPRFEDVLEYLGAFYHGFEVKEYTPTLGFEPWESKKRKGASTPCTVALKEGPTDSLTGIRTRPSLDGIFSHQLNLSDLLDFAIRILPQDAYALLLLVDQDLYEDEEDEFCCGRAYGGSHVAVVSSARYNPLFYGHESVDVAHIWPASHCAAHIASQSAISSKDGKPSSRRTKPVADSEAPPQEESGAIHQAVAAFTKAATTAASTTDGLWLFCLARTASHELGHCFCMDHCMYYACCMQGTASVAEDCRQPPYLCPVCSAKLLHSAEQAHGAGFDREQYLRGLYEAMKMFCAKWKHVGAFAGFEAWLGARLQARVL